MFWLDFYLVRIRLTLGHDEMLHFKSMGIIIKLLQSWHFFQKLDHVEKLTHVFHALQTTPRWLWLLNCGHYQNKNEKSERFSQCWRWFCCFLRLCLLMMSYSNVSVSDEIMTRNYSVSYEPEYLSIGHISIRKYIHIQRTMFWSVTRVKKYLSLRSVAVLLIIITRRSCALLR